MDFELSEDQRAFQATARQFARDEMMPQAREWDENEIFPVEELRKAAALGFGGIYVKDDVGGSALSRGSTPPSSSRSWRRAAPRPPPTSRSTTWRPG